MGGGKQFRLYGAAGDQLFFCGVAAAVGKSKLIMGYITSANEVTSKTFDFGVEITTYISCLLQDGGVAALMQTRSTERSTDLILFQTDKSFNVINSDH